MDSNNILSVISIVVAVGTAIIGIINHKRIRSKCGQKEIVASIDIETTSPELKIKTPYIPPTPAGAGPARVSSQPMTVIEYLENENKKTNL
jgi:hypothetical protein